MDKQFNFNTVLEVEAAILRHIERGGWLGSVWPQYVLRGCRANETEIDLGLERAEKRYWEAHGYTLWAASQTNFAEEARACIERKEDAA